MIETYFVTGKELEKYREVIPEDMYSPGIMLFVAKSEGVMTGILVAEAAGLRDIIIRYIFVPEQYRLTHVGRALEELLYEMASAMGMDRIVVSFVRDEDEDMAGFFTSLGFEVMDESGLFELDMSDTAEKIADYTRGKPDVRTLALGEVSAGDYDKLRHRLLEKKTRSDRGGNLYMDPGTMEHFDPDISFIAMDKNGEPAGAILFKPYDGDFVLEYICVLSPGIGDVMFDLLEAAANRALEKAVIGKKMFFHGINRSVVRMAKKLELRPRRVMDLVWMEKYI